VNIQEAALYGIMGLLTMPVPKNRSVSEKEIMEYIDHFARCKQHWSRNTSCFSL